jgi:hypothetical protein
MKSFNFGILFLLVALWSCKNHKEKAFPQGAVSDTTLVLNQALSEAVSVKFMPGASALTRPYRFKDSILVTSKASLLSFLPVSVGRQKFKVMESHAIISILRADSNNLNLPHYLIVSDFVANDSGYYLQVQNLSSLPYGGGGSLGLYYIENGDTLMNVKRSAWSIN